MSGAEDEAVLADILETAGQRAGEIRVEIASLKEKTGNNAVTVPQLLKGDAIPDVTEPAEATRQDEPDASLQFTVSTPSGERQAPPKTEDGTDTEDLERMHAELHSSVQHYVRSSSNLAAGRQPDAAGWPVGAVDVAGTGTSDGSCEAAGPQADDASWQGRYQGMLGKLSKSQATEQQCASSVAAILKSAGMASAVDSSSCNMRVQHLTTPFAQDTSQAAAVAAGAITSQHLEEETVAASSSILPSPVHVVDGPYMDGEGEAASAAAGADAGAEDAEQWGPTWSAHSPSKCGNAGADGSCLAHDAQGSVTPKRLVVPASAADLPVQAVIDELDELLSWSSRTPTHQQQLQQQGQGRLFSRNDNVEHAEEELQRQQGGSSIAARAMAAAAGAAASAGGAAAAGDEEDWVLRWLRSQKGHMSRCNSTSCLLSDEYMQRSDRSSSSSNNSRMRRSCSLPTEPLSRASMSAGGVEGAAAATGGGTVDQEAGLKPNRQQQQLDSDIKDEILAHLRLAAAFRPRARDSPNSSSLPNPCTPPAAAAAAYVSAAAAAAGRQAAMIGAAAGSPPAGHAASTEAMEHGVSLVDWVGKYIGAQPASAAPTGSSLEEVDADEAARLQLLCGGVLREAGAAGGAAGAARGSAELAAAAAARAGVRNVPGQAGAAATGDCAVPASPKTMSKSAQLYQQLLMRSHGSAAGSSPKGSSGGGSSSSGKGRQGGSRSGGNSLSQAGGCRSPVRGRGSTSAGGAEQEVAASVAGGNGWPSPGAAQRLGSPGKQRLELQLPDSEDEPRAAGCASVTCTTCGSPVLCGRPGTTQHTRMSIVDLTSEIAAANAADGAVEAAADSAGNAEASSCCNAAAAPPHCAAGAALGAAQPADSPDAHGHNPAEGNAAYSASVSVAALLGGGAHDDNSSSGFADVPGYSSLRLHSPGAVGSPSKGSSYAAARDSGSAPATPKGSNRRKQLQPSGYAALGKSAGYAAAAASSRRSSHVAAMRMSYGAAARPSGYAAGAAAAAERVGRPRAGTASLPGAAAGAFRAAQAEEVPAVMTAISCGQLLAAAALERALGRVSAGGAAAAAGSAGADAAAQDDEEMLEQELQLSRAKPKTAGDKQQQGEQAGNAGDRPSLSGLLELERDMEEAALEDELATLQPCSSSAAAALGQKQQASSSVFVYRLQPTNEPGGGVSGAGAGAAGGAGGSTTAAAAAAAALQTLAACASRKVPRCASLSPNRRTSSSVSPSRMNSSTTSKQTSAGASKRSSSTDIPSRGSAGVSRSTSGKSCISNAPGFGSSSSRDGCSSAGSSRVWRPGGRRTSAKDDCRKLQDYESARSRILGPVSEAGAASSAGDVNDGRGGGRPSPRPSAFGRSSSPAKKPGRAGAAAAAAAARGQQGVMTGGGSKAEVGASSPGATPASRGRVTAMTTAAAAPTSKSARAAARAAAGSTPPRSPAAASSMAGSRAAAPWKGRAAAAAAAVGTTSSRGPTAVRSRTTATPAAASASTPPEVHEQGVQANIRPQRIEVVPLPQVPQLLDPSSLLDELSRKSKRPARHSTPGRLQAASRFPALVLPGQQDQLQAQHQHGSSSPTTSQVEEAIKAAQVALLQRRWQISQLRKTMAQHGIASTAGMRSSRSSSTNHGSLMSSILRHESHGLGAAAGLGGSALGASVSGILGGAGYSTGSGSIGRRQDRFSYDSLTAVGSSSKAQPLTPAQLLQGFSTDEKHDAAAAAGEGTAVVSSYASQAAEVAALIKQRSSMGGAAADGAAAAAAAAAAVASHPTGQVMQHSTSGSRSPSPSRLAAAAVPAAARYRSASAFDAASRLCSEDPDMPLRPSSAQAVVMKAAAAAAAAAAAMDQQHYTATIFATPGKQQQQDAAAVVPEPTAGMALSSANFGSRASSCCKEFNPLRRRSSVGSPAAAGGSAGGSAPGGAVQPPWSAPRRVSSSGLTGEELMAYYRRSSVTEAAEAAAEAAAAGEVPAAGLQLDVLLRAFNALAKRKNTADKSAALAALMDQIVAIADQAAAAKQEAAAAAAAGEEPLAGMDARELTVDSDSSALVVESSKLDVLGRSVNSSPRPAGLLCGTISGRGSPGIAGGSVLQVRKGDMRAGWQSACAERQAAHNSLLSTPRHKRPASAGYAADLAALNSQAISQQQQLLPGPHEHQDGEEEEGSGDGMSPTHAMLMHTAARLGEFAGSPGGSDLGSCTGIPPEALAAAAPYGNGIVVVRMSTTETSGRLPLLRDTAAGKAVLAGIDGTSLTVQQAVHWLKVGLTRLPSSSEGGLQGGGQRQGLTVPAAQQGSRASTPQSPSRKARSRPCSPFRACFASQAALSSEDEEEPMDLLQQQQQQREGVHFEMDSSSQLVMVVPQSLAADPQDALPGQQQQAQQGGSAAGVHKYTVTGVALPSDEGCQAGVSGSGSHCLELITSAGRHRIELASARDFAGLLAGLNAMLLLKEAGGDVAEKLGVLPIEDTAWAGAVEGWQGAA